MQTVRERIPEKRIEGTVKLIAEVATSRGTYLVSSGPFCQRLLRLMLEQGAAGLDDEAATAEVEMRVAGTRTAEVDDSRGPSYTTNRESQYEVRAVFVSKKSKTGGREESFIAPNTVCVEIAAQEVGRELA